MRVLGSVLALLTWTLAACAVGEREERWQKLENSPGCVVWNKNPVEQETVTWSGACANGKAQGRGTVVWLFVEDGEWKQDNYEGEMKDGMMHGHGVYVAIGHSRYEGDYKDDKRHGHGVYVWGPDSEWAGDRYEGDYKDGKQHGHGVFVWGPNSEWAGNRYEGDLKGGKFHGHGIYYFANGDKCEGDWREDRLLGTGQGWAEGREVKCYQV